MTLYNNKYRIESNRLRSWNYCSNGLYFITICLKYRKHYFGHITRKKMILSPEGKIADKIWQKIPQQFDFVKLNEYIIMPDHVHGILIIYNVHRSRISHDYFNNTDRGGITGENNPMFLESISRIIRWYKGRCSYEIHKKKSQFCWQSNYHDRVIRNSLEYSRIKKYIINNPKNWLKKY